MSQRMVSLADFLCYLREQVIEARDSSDNQQRMTALFYTLNMLDEATVHTKDATYEPIIDELTNAIRHTTIAEFKIRIPSEEDIRKLEQTRKI